MAFLICGYFSANTYSLSLTNSPVMTIKQLLPLLIFSTFSPVLLGQLTITSSFDPPEVAGLCSIAYDHVLDEVWVYDCSDDSLYCYSSAGIHQRTIARPGEVANDVDIFVSTGNITLDATAFPPGTLFMINGETGVAEIYGIDKLTGVVIDTLVTMFGNSHVVGGGYDSVSQNLFLVQDKVPAATIDNTIAEVNPQTGVVQTSFQTTGVFSVNYGDMEVLPSGNLLVVSSDETSIGEFTQAGTLLSSYPLPAGITSLSGISVHCGATDLWVNSTSGTVYQLNGGPCVNTILPSKTELPDLMESEAEASTITVFPNPTSGLLEIIGAEEGDTYRLRNQSGSLLKEGLATGVKLDLSELPAGIYLLEIYNGRQTVVERVVVE